MNLSHLRYFVKLADLQHYAKAAKELYISQPSLTHAIKSLESELGVPLFQKVGRGVELTDFGHEFKDCVLRGLVEIDRGIALASDQVQGLRGKVNIGAIYSIEGDYLPRVMSEFRGQFGEGVQFQLNQALTLNLIERLEKDEFDVAFTAYVRNKPDLVFELVLAHQLVAVCHSDHELADRKSIKLAELKGYNVHSYRGGTPISEEVADVIAGTGIRAKGSFEDEVSLGGMISHDSSICGLGTLTLGLRCFPNLSIIPIEDIPDDFHRIYMVYKRSKLRSSAVDQFISFVQDYVPPKEARQYIEIGG